MNDRWGEPPQITEPAPPVSLSSCVPRIRYSGNGAGIKAPSVVLPSKKMNGRGTGKRETGITKDSFFTIWRDGAYHIISENYFYKTEPYYTILQLELEGKPVKPSSSSVLDAYVVPVCLERAHLAGIRVCEWGISQGYAPLPAILYGLNYFAKSSDYVVVNDNEKVKEAIKHITHKGKYPFCYQKLGDDATIHPCISVFGNTASACSAVNQMAKKVYDLFSLPLVTMNLVKYGDQYMLSSLSPAKYSQLTGEERSLLTAYLSRQEFL